MMEVSEALKTVMVASDNCLFCTLSLTTPLIVPLWAEADRVIMTRHKPVNSNFISLIRFRFGKLWLAGNVVGKIWYKLLKSNVMRIVHLFKRRFFRVSGEKYSILNENLRGQPQSFGTFNPTNVFQECFVKPLVLHHCALPGR